MRGFIIAVSIAVMLAGNTLINDENIINAAENAVDLSSDVDIDELVSMARNGEKDAYIKLAECYRDGNGVEQSYVNMVGMCLLYDKRTGNESLNEFIEMLYDDNPFRIITDILDNKYSYDEILEKSYILKRISPEDAMVVDALLISKAGCKDAKERCLSILKQAGDEGSEIGAVLPLVIYEKEENDECYEKQVLQVADRFPMLYNKIGRKYMEKYHVGGNNKCLYKSVEYFNKADQHGFLVPKNAEALLEIYEILKDDGFVYSKSEKARLMKIAGK